MRLALFLVDQADTTCRIISENLTRELADRLAGIVVIGKKMSDSLWRSGWKVFRTLRNENIDVAHIHFWGKDHWGAGPVLKALSVPYGVTFHAWIDLISVSRTRRWILRIYLRWLLRGARFVTAVSENTLENLLRDFPAIRKKASVVGNGLAIPCAEGTRRVFPFPYIISVGNSGSMKGWDILLFALKDLLAKHSKIRLVLCGHPYASGIDITNMISQLRLEKRVVLTGWVDRERLALLLRDSLFYVSPSRYDSFGLALGEAMLLGKAVVATKTEGSRTLIEHGKTGLLADVRDPAALSAAMNRLARNGALRRSLGAAARTAAGRWRWRDAAEAYSRLYHDAVRNSAATRERVAPTGTRVSFVK